MTMVGVAESGPLGCARSAGASSDSLNPVDHRCSPQQLVLEFHLAFRLPVRGRPGIPPAQEVKLRDRLLREEVDELARAVAIGDLIGIADSLGDVVYVLYGTALTYGIDLDAIVAEVHRANMSKLGRDGLPCMRHDGKVLKGPNYRPPDIQGVLEIDSKLLSPA